MAAVASRPATSGGPPSPDTYTPKHLAEKILTSKRALDGERKEVIVLFADLKGSMKLLADRDPEKARKLLDPVLERMMGAVHHYAGAAQGFLAWTLQSLGEFDEGLAVGRGARPRIWTFLTSLAVRGISGTR